VDSKGDGVTGRGLDDLLARQGIVVEPVTPNHAALGRAAYRDYGKGSDSPAQLNFGDCFAYALARATGEPLLFKGNDFSQTDIRSAIQPG
jgi:ribonuclease VapC